MNKLTILAAAILTGTVLSGCSNDKITPWSTRWDMSPELQTVNRTGNEQWNRLFRAGNTNVRYAQDDLYRVMMLDEPNNLGRVPIP
ncbi:MAG: hypothetical protein IT443_10870 [Phycisphaeraceae bacterium]|nr:hypothetical protein [Phycisphaeraceae bacterium]